MIRRDLSVATGREFDLVIIGGGIYGVSLLQEATRQGLSACLCEAADFGGGTTWNSLRIVHGGLRYLQNLDFRRFFQSVAARREVARQFPALVRPLQFLMPLYGLGLKRNSVMHAALMLNDTLTGRRNVGVAESARLASGRILDATATRAAFPSVRPDGLRGAASWQDYQMISSERIVIELLRDACRCGAVALNYAPVTDIVIESGVARGVEVRESRSNESYVVAARAIVNCAGPHLRTLARGRGGDADRLFRPSLAFNVLLDLTLPTRSALAVAAPAPDAPVMFVVPIEGGLLAGTRHVARPAATTEALPTEAEQLEFLGLLNAAIPGLGARLDHVRRVFAGLLPAVQALSTDLVKRELLVDHGREGGVGRLYSVSGVKFTTARDVARQTLALMGFARPARQDTRALELSSLTLTLTDVRRFRALSDDALESVIGQVIEEEAAMCVDDLVLRRTNWGATGADLEPLRTRVAEHANLPVTAFDGGAR